MAFPNSETAHSDDSSPQTEHRTCSGSVWVWLALLISVVALAGSLILSIGMGLKACPLCFYQRTFVMSLVAVLGMGLLFRIGQRLAILALPLATAGLGVALFHAYLESSGALECPLGVFGWGTAPQQSLAVFLALFLLLLADALKRGLVGIGAVVVGLVIGGALALASSTSNPPMPAAPTQPYTTPLEICRPPFRGP